MTQTTQQGRYIAPDRFFWDEKGTPLPEGHEIIRQARHVISIENAFRTECRRELEEYARHCGANALVRCNLEHIEDEYGPLWRLSGIPAVIGIRDPAGVAGEELARDFCEPASKQGDLANGRRREWRIFAFMMLAVAVAAVCGFLWIAVMTGSGSLVW